MSSLRLVSRVIALAAGLAVTASPAFAQTPPCPDPPLSPPISARVDPDPPCAARPTSLVFETCGPCWDIRSAAFDSGAIVVRAIRPNPEACITRQCIHESATVPLGILAPGSHAFVVRYESTVVLRDSTSADSVYCTFVHQDTVEFFVSPDCPPPPPGPIQFLETVTIGRGAPCDTCAAVACQGDSIPVRLAGSFPSSCFSFVRVVPFSLEAAVNVPPRLRIVYEQDECTERPCLPVVTPWETMVLLPPLPVRTNFPYFLPVEGVLMQRDCQGPTDTTFVGHALFPFTVTDTCGTPPPMPTPCHLSGFVRDSRDTCDAFVGPGQSATVDYRIGSTVDLHGLQGTFRFDPVVNDTRLPTLSDLRIVSIETIGAATGMALQWQPIEGGAEFVLFSTGNGHIPAAPPMPDTARVPILRIRVEVSPDVDRPLPPRATLRAHDLLAADRNGQEVPGCPIMFIVEPRDQYVVFCTGPSCDANRDGARDVRDLVVMVNCINDLMLCDPTGIDCDHDQDLDIDDVYCCALEILNGGPIDTTGSVPDPALAVRFGAPVVSEGVVEIPVTLEGSPSVAAARVVLRYPGDRYVLDDVAFPGRSNWLELFQDRSGRVVVGLVGMGRGPTHTGPFHHQFSVRLALRPGQTVGGDLALDEADFANYSGVALVGDLGVPSVNLGRELALSAGQPNPFGREIGFSVTMVRAGDLDVTVLDVGGREVAHLHRGAASAGAHPFRWDGRRDGGDRLPDGIYFIRARGLDVTLARKVILLRDR